MQGLGTKLSSVDSEFQFDQMDRLFVQYLAIHNHEILPKVYKIGQSGLKILLINPQKVAKDL